MVALGGIADMNGRVASAAWIEFDPSATSAANFVVMHNAAFSTTMW
jgi:hypothetical protein